MSCVFVLFNRDCLTRSMPVIGSKSLIVGGGALQKHSVRLSPPVAMNFRLLKLVNSLNSPSENTILNFTRKDFTNVTDYIPPLIFFNKGNKQIENVVFYTYSGGKGLK